MASTIFHEAAHGLAALKLGDTTAHDAGLVTLDPLAHIQRSPFGMVIVPIVSFIMGGWMIGWASTPYDPYWAHRHPKSSALMAFAGPAANLTLALIAGVLIRIGLAAGVFMPPPTANFQQMTAAVSAGPANGAATLLSIVLSLNLILFVFNLLPLPPLDGSAVVELFLKPGAAERYTGLLQQPAAQMIGLVVAWNLMDRVFGPMQHLLLILLYPGVSYS